jgi:hypothetical protein
MKWQAAIVLLAIVVSIIVPPSLSLTVAHGKQAAIGALDVCHSATPALSSHGDMPCMHESPRRFLPLSQNKTAEITIPPFAPFLMAFQDERPPKI